MQYNVGKGMNSLLHSSGSSQSRVSTVLTTNPSQHTTLPSRTLLTPKSNAPGTVLSAVIGSAIVITILTSWLFVLFQIYYVKEFQLGRTNILYKCNFKVYEGIGLFLTIAFGKLLT